MRDRKCAVASCRWFAAFVSIWVSCSAFGQTPAPVPAAPQRARVLAPHIPVASKAREPIPMPPGVDGAIVGGPWMVDASFKSSIYLKNGVENSAVTVTPILFLSNGNRYALPKVELAAAGTAIVDINAALQDLGVAPYATLSGYVEINYHWPWDPICATVRNLDTVHSLIFTYGFRPSEPRQLPGQPVATAGPQVVEGIWWKQEAGVAGFVALANTTGQLMSAVLDISDAGGARLAEHAVTISPHGMKTVALGELASAPTTEGGIRISYSGNSTDLLISGGLEDQTVGYSAIMPFALNPLPSGNANPIAEIGLMNGPADPMMRFPAGITFTPYTVVRNTSNAPLSTTPTVWWMAGGASHSFQLPAITLAAYQTRRLDLVASLAAAGLRNSSQSINLVFDVQGDSSALLMAGGSVDQNNTYVFEVAPRWIMKSASKSLA